MGQLKRRQLFVDKAVQGALLKRTVLYWILSTTTIFLAIIIWKTLTGPARLFYTQFDDIWFHNGAVFIVLTLMLPIILVDCIKISNRFCGPAMRLRNAMRELVNGNPVSKLKFRDDDFWQSYAEDFNALAAKIHKLEEQLARDSASGKSNPENPENETSIPTPITETIDFEGFTSLPVVDASQNV